MAHENQDGGLIRRYLLGELAEYELEQLEEKMMADNEFFSAVLLAEDEMIEEYVQGELPASDRAGFEASFLCTPEGRQKVAYATALNKYVKDVSPSPDPEVLIGKEPIAKRSVGESPRAEGQPAGLPAAEELPLAPNVSRPVWWRRPALAPYLAAAAAVIVIGLGLGIWRITSPSEVTQGLKALAYAYRDQRPLEARISGFDYAPVSTTRGGEQKVDRTARNLAESVLLDAVVKHPNAATHHAAGRLYLAEKKFDEAIEQFEAAIKTDPNNAQLHSDYGAALLENGKTDREEDKSGKSSEEFARALEHLKRALELDGSLLDALFNRALLHQELMLHQQAEEDWEKYLEKDPNSRWAEEARRRLKSLTEKEQSSQETDKPSQVFLRAYQNADNKSAWSAFSQARERTGNSITEGLIDDYLELTGRGKDREARSELRVLKYAGELEGERANDSFTTNLARFYGLIGAGQQEQAARARSLVKAANDSYRDTEFERAIELYAKAQRIFAAFGDSCEGNFVEFRIGTCYLRVKPDRSISIFERLATVCEAKGYRWLLAQSLNGLSDAQSSKRNFSRTLEYADVSLRLSQEIDDPRGVLRNMQLPVAIHQQIGEYSKSLGLILNALKFADTFSPKPHEIWTFYHQASFNLYSMNCPLVALDFQTEALRLAMKSGEPLLKSRSHALQGLILQSLRRFDLAIDSCQSALAEGQEIQGESSRNNVIANSTLNLAHLYKDSGDFQRAVDSYNQALQLHKKLNLDIYLFQAHKGKLLSLIKLNDDAATNDEIKTATALVEEYRPRIKEESNRINFFDLAQSIYDEAIDFTYTRLKEPTEAFSYAENSRCRSLLDLLESPSQVIDHAGEPDLRIGSVSQPRGLRDIEQLLPDDVEILQYSVLDDRLIMWVISRGRVESRDQEVSAAKLTEDVQSYLETIVKKREDGEEALTLARRLYSLLITPVESLLDKHNTIYIVPDKILNYLPFGALVGPENRYFIQDYVFGFSPSSTVFLHCSDVATARQNIKEENILAVGNPTFDRSKFSLLPDLPSAAVEATEVAKIYHYPFAFTGDAATKSSIIREMSKANVIHFASHYVTEESPMKSKLLLAKESKATGERQAKDLFLEVSEIYGMKLPNTRLAVLSACQTGIERSYRGEGAISIARPFIRAGVPIVVASLWPVETKSTAELMVRFHRYRKQEGRSTIGALRQAQLDMLDMPEAGYSHPYFWAAFSVIGGHAGF